jgi:hypothetical protein
MDAPSVPQIKLRKAVLVLDFVTFSSVHLGRRVVLGALKTAHGALSVNRSPRSAPPLHSSETPARDQITEPITDVGPQEMDVQFDE